MTRNIPESRSRLLLTLVCVLSLQCSLSAGEPSPSSTPPARRPCVQPLPGARLGSVWNPIRIEPGTAVEGVIPVSDTGAQLFYYLEVEPNTPYIVELDRVTARFRPDGAAAVKHVAVNLAEELGKGRLLGEQIRPGETGKRIPVRVTTGCLFVEVGSWVHAEPVTFRLRVYPEAAAEREPLPGVPLTERDKDVLAQLRERFEREGKQVHVHRWNPQMVHYMFDMAIDIPDESLEEVAAALPTLSEMLTESTNQIWIRYSPPETIRITFVSKGMILIHAERRFDSDQVRIVYDDRFLPFLPESPTAASTHPAEEAGQSSQEKTTAATGDPQAESMDDTVEGVGRDRMFLHAMFGVPDHFLISFTYDENTGQAARTETWGYEALSRYFVFRDGIYAGGRTRTFMPTVPDAFALNPLSIHPDLSPTDLPALVGHTPERTESRPPYTLYVYGDEGLVFWFDGEGRLVRVLRAPEEVETP